MNNIPVLESFWVFISFCPCWRGIQKLFQKRNVTFFSPPLFCSQYLGLGCIFWAAFAPAGQGFAVPGGVYSVSRVLGLSFTGCSLHSQIPAVGHLAQVCRAGAQPHSAPRKGSSCFKKQWWEHSLGYLRNALCTDQGVQMPPSLSCRLFPQFSFQRQLSKGWLEQTLQDLAQLSFIANNKW